MEGTFTQATRLPELFVKFSISWGSWVVPSDAVKTMSWPFVWGSAARSGSEGRLTRTGKFVWVPETCRWLMVMFFR